MRREFSSVPKALPAAVELYIRYMQARRAKPSTVANRHYKLACFAHYLAVHQPQPPLFLPPYPTQSHITIPDLPITAITPQAIRDYLAEVAKKHSAEDVRNRLGAIKSLCSFLVVQGALKDNPAADIPYPPPPSKLPRTLSAQELRALNQAAHALIGEGRMRPAVVYLIARDTAIRLPELAALTPEEYLRHPPALRINAEEPFRRRTIPISEETAQALDAYLPTRHHKTTTLIDAVQYTIRTDVYEVSDRAGIRPRVHYQDIRWTAALAIYRADPQVAQAALGYSDEGWSSAATTLRRLAAARAC